jgi:BlaI family transcriptional regulator, penicillinase repressor
MKKPSHLTPGEFELMEILWPLGEASVKEVWSRVDPARALAYTTVMTVLEKMYRKGILAQRKKGKAFLYSAVLSREEALKGVIDHVRQAYFGGSHADLTGFVTSHPMPQSAAQAATTPAASDKESALAGSSGSDK